MSLYACGYEAWAMYAVSVAITNINRKGIIVVLKTLPIQSGLSIFFIPLIRLAASINSKAASERIRGLHK